MKNYIHLIIKKPFLVLAAIVVVTAFFGYGLTKLETSNNQDSELPDTDPIVKTMEQLEEKFGKKDIILVGIETDDVFNPQTLQKVIDISGDVALIDGVIESQIFSIASTNNIVKNDWGVEIGSFVENVPETDADMQALKSELLSNDLSRGILVSPDGSFTAIAANITEGYDESQVFDKVQAIVNKYQGPEKMFIAGDPIQQQEIDRGVKSDLGFLVPLAITLVLFGLFISFRTVKGIVLPYLVIVLTIIWTLGFMGHAGLDMTVVSSLIPILMIVVSSSYGIHMVHRYYEELTADDNKTAVKKPSKAFQQPL